MYNARRLLSLPLAALHTLATLPLSLAILSLAALVGLSGCAGMAAERAGQQVRLYGTSEVPPNTSAAWAAAAVEIAPDRTVTVTLNPIGMTPTAAHIHEGAAGTNGPVIVTLVKITDDAFVAPQGARLTEAQYAAYKAGNTYLNVHSAAYPGGEIRAQIAGR